MSESLKIILYISVILVGEVMSFSSKRPVVLNLFKPDFFFFNLPSDFSSLYIGSTLFSLKIMVFVLEYESKIGFR